MIQHESVAFWPQGCSIPGPSALENVHSIKCVFTDCLWIYVWKRVWGFNLHWYNSFYNPWRAQPDLSVCAFLHVCGAACSCICLHLSWDPEKVNIVCDIPGVCRETVGKLKPSTTVGYTRHSPQPAHRQSQTENWEGWGPNYTWWEVKRMLRLFAALCGQRVYSDRVCVSKCNGCSCVAHCGQEQPHCDRLFKECYQFYLN